MIDSAQIFSVSLDEALVRFSRVTGKLWPIPEMLNADNENDND